MTAIDVAFFREHGWLLVRSGSGVTPALLSEWCDDVAHAANDGPGLHYREATADGPKLCRSEDFVPWHEGLRSLLTDGEVVATAAQLLEEPVVLYKEKINYKLAGGAGYSAHQDAPAYLFVDRHLSCMIAVDASTTVNGCLEVVSGLHHEILPVDERGCIAPALAASLSWEPTEMEPGDVLWFHSRTPHRSGANQSSHDRRALYPTYNARSEGDLRTAYYARKAKELESVGAESDRVVLSLIGDFEGRPL